MNQKKQIFWALIVSGLLFTNGAIAAVDATANTGAGLNVVIDNIVNIFTSAKNAIPVIAFVLGAISFLGGIWAFRQAGNQQAPQKWQMGAVIALVVGVFLMYWTTAQTIGGSSLLGQKTAPTAIVK